jgi:hypothetical protein
MQWAPGQPGRIPEAWAPTIQGWVQDGPQSCGLDRANWPYEELAAYLYHTTGIEGQRTAMRVFCQRHSIRPYRPTYRYLRGAPEEQRLAREELEWCGYTLPDTRRQGTARNLRGVFDESTRYEKVSRGIQGTRRATGGRVRAIHGPDRSCPGRA